MRQLRSSRGITAGHNGLEGLEALLRRAGCGDEEAFGSFYDQSCAQVFGAAVKLAPGAADPQELVQQAYLQAWLHAPRAGLAKGTAMQWLLGILLQCHANARHAS